MSRYAHSELLLERALRTIPLGSQTFSKSKTQYPIGVSPFFIQRGRGSHVWDVDNNEYIDFINSLAAITLGYCDPDVDAAVRGQLEDGVIFSLPHPVEMEVAEQLVKLVPCAEMVRFGKNGSDAYRRGHKRGRECRCQNYFQQSDHKALSPCRVGIEIHSLYKCQPLLKYLRRSGHCGWQTSGKKHRYWQASFWRRQDKKHRYRLCG